jgi:peptidoglycan/LPS O-acetylase OafA/YrhL
MKRGDIQALRGFSVLAVLFYHLQISSFKGGFLGVDIFFVISGFVITERLAHGQGPMGTQLINFYKRRAKRILPASLFRSSVLTAICVRLFLSPLSWHRFGFDGIATTFFAGNIRFCCSRK